MSPLFSTRCSWPHKRKKWGIYTFIAPFFLITHWPLFFFFSLKLESHSLCLSYFSHFDFLIIIFIYFVFHFISFHHSSFCFFPDFTFLPIPRLCLTVTHPIITPVRVKIRCQSLSSCCISLSLSVTHLVLPLRNQSRNLAFREITTPSDP
jgi:hypothetical protein